MSWAVVVVTQVAMLAQQSEDKALSEAAQHQLRSWEAELQMLRQLPQRQRQRQRHHTNCVNCGAPHEDANSCSYCGTRAHALSMEGR